MTNAAIIQCGSLEQIASMVAHKLRVMLAHAVHLCANRSDDGSGGLVNFSKHLQQGRASRAVVLASCWAKHGGGEDESSCVPAEVATFFDGLKLKQR